MPSCTYGSVSSASSELENLCRQAHGFPSPEDVHRQVRAGASVLTHCPGYFMPILHHFVLHGKVDCVAACLSSHSAIDFTETRNKWEFTAFHCVARKNSPEISRALLCLLFDRLKVHFNDTFDWSVEDLHFDNFISALARYQQLSTSLALLKLYLPLPEMVPISLNLVWMHDWEALGEEQKYFAVQPNSILRANEATRELSHLCQTKKEQITLQKVESCIKEGADIVFRDPDMNYSILHYFILNGMRECVSVLLSTSQPIDFTVVDDGGFTPLHFVCFKENSAETAIKMLTDIIDRIEHFPDDIFCFSQTSCAGLDFISCAARYQKLSVLWPVVKAVPFFDDKVSPILLVTPVWRYDWEELGEHEQRRFALKKGVIEANRSTAMFLRECELCEWRPAVNVIENHILHGANIFFSDLDMNKPAFFQFIIDGMVDIVTVCMKNAASPLDFRTTGKHGMTSLHCLASRPFETDEKNDSHNGDTVQMLSLILHRLCTHPFDVIDWKQKDDDGYDFISYAAYYGNLSSFWPLIKNVFPLEESSGVVDLFLPVVRDDWDRLRSEQKYFKLASQFARPFR